MKRWQICHVTNRFNNRKKKDIEEEEEKKKVIGKDFYNPKRSFERKRTSFQMKMNVPIFQYDSQ